MNILVLTPWFPDHPNDQHGNFVLDSIESLCALGHRVHVLVTRPIVPHFGHNAKRHGSLAISSQMFLRGFTLSCRKYLSIPRSYLRFISNWLYLKGCSGVVRRMIIKNNIDVVHSHTELAGYLACAVADKIHVPVVTTLHGINRDRRYLGGPGQPAFLRRTFSRSERLVIVGAPLFDFVRNYVDSLDHVRVVHNGFREQGALPFRNRRVFNSGESVQIISVSNLVDGKGIDINLEAFGRPEVTRFSNWHYHIVGDGPLRSKFQAKAQELNIANRVTFHGRCDHNTVYKLLSTCDIFSLPSAPEAFGIAYIEAMAHGLLTIGVQGQGPSSFIEDGHTGILIHEKDIMGLSSRLISIFNDPKYFGDIANAGREYVWGHCTWRAHAQALTDVFQEAIECTPNTYQKSIKA